MEKPNVHVKVDEYQHSPYKNKNTSKISSKQSFASQEKKEPKSTGQGKTKTTTLLDWKLTIYFLRPNLCDTPSFLFGSRKN